MSTSEAIVVPFACEHPIRRIRFASSMTLSRRSMNMGLVAGAIGLVGVGCSGTGSGKKASVTPTDMPEGAEWNGVYYDVTYGYFHIVQEAKVINGKWQRPKKDKWGELHGEVTGNVVKFTWTEYTIGSIGANAEKKGKGYLVYSRPPGENVEDKVDGELGRDNDEIGIKLAAVKQRNVNPDLGSIGGTGTKDLQGGDWDNEQNNEKGEPEKPK